MKITALTIDPCVMRKEDPTWNGPRSTAGGTQTPGIDSGFYYGGASFVTRVNRIHTVWLTSAAVS